MPAVDWLDIAYKVGLAIVILLVTWLIATLVKWGLSKLVSRLPFLKKQGDGGASLAKSLGTVGSLIVWLFGLVAVLQLFNLDSVLAPIQGLLNTVMEYLPNIIAAAFIFFIGYVIAKIVKQIIEASLGLVNFGSIAAKVKRVGPADADEATAQTSATEQTSGDEPGSVDKSQKIGSIVGNLAFALILIVVAIVALQALAISVITDPAQQMLSLILDAIPVIVAAAVLLAIGFLIAKFVGTILESTLRGIGTDKAATKLGVLGDDKSASTILTRIAQVAIVVFFAIMAARLLDFPEISSILNTVLALGGQVLFGAVIVGVGFLIAKIVSSTVGDSTGSKIARFAIIVLFSAMGLKFMGIADSIITLGFGALVVGGALAAALAFGIGGRDAAARVLNKQADKCDEAEKTK